MPTLGEHRESLIATIVSAYDEQTFDAFLWLKVNIQRDTIASSVHDFKQRVVLVTQSAERNGWIDKLLTQLKGDRPQRPDIAELIDRIVKGWKIGGLPAPADPYKLFFTSQGGFVDREGARETFRSMHTSGVDRLLLLSGPTGSGKTYTWQFLKTVADIRGFPAIYVDLVAWQAGGTAHRIVESMAGQLEHGLRSEFDSYAREPRMAAQLAEWFAGAVRQRGRCCWVFFDHLDRIVPSSEHLSLLRELVRVAYAGLADLRIVVTGLPEEEDYSEFAPLAEYFATGVCQEDVAAFIRTIAAHLEIQIEPETVQDAIDRIYAAIPSTDKPATPALVTRRIYKVALALFPGLST